MARSTTRRAVCAFIGAAIAGGFSGVPALAGHEGGGGGGGGGGGDAQPVVMTLLFTRTERGRLQFWNTQFRINSEAKEILTTISERQPRILDGILVRLTRGLEADMRPTIAEVKQAVEQTIEERTGSIAGLDITVIKLKQVQ